MRQASGTVADPFHGAGEVAFNFAGSNTVPVETKAGINTLLLSESPTPPPDIVALAATRDNNGIVNIPGATGTGFFGVATVNVGTGAVIAVTADTDPTSPPSSLTLCQTNPTTGACLASPTNSVTAQINAGTTPTFAIFAQGNGVVALNALTNRIFVRFKDAAGVTRGATSVAVRIEKTARPASPQSKKPCPGGLLSDQCAAPTFFLFPAPAAERVTISA